MTFSIFYKYTGKLPGYTLSGIDVVQTMVSGYQIMDATAGKLFWKDRIGITAGCKNLFDVTNINTTSVVGGVHSGASSGMPLSTGRNYFLKLSFNISKG